MNTPLKEKKAVLGGIVLLVGIFFFVWWWKGVGKEGVAENYVCHQEVCFRVDLAVTAAEKARGLMFRRYMGPDEGMLFINAREGWYSFWMKNTFIHLDIIWINKDKEVIFIAKDVPPCESGSCPLLISDQKAQYILELNGGITDKIGLRVGDRLTFKLVEPASE